MYVRAYDYAAQILVTARIADGAEFITLDYLYTTLGATDKETKTSVRWAIQNCRNAGLLTNTDTRGVYRVC